MPKTKKNKSKHQMVLDKGKVLFVEDDRFLAEMFRQKFVFEGYKPIIAFTAISAVMALNEQQPVAIILDIVLPDSECWMIMEYLRKKRNFKPVPVIILTNWGSPEYRRRAKQLKADAFIVKSEATPSQVVKIMADLINKYKKK